jgi:hypothetical protein
MLSLKSCPWSSTAPELGLTSSTISSLVDLTNCGTQLLIEQCLEMWTGAFSNVTQWYNSLVCGVLLSPKLGLLSLFLLFLFITYIYCIKEYCDISIHEYNALWPNSSTLSYETFCFWEWKPYFLFPGTPRPLPQSLQFSATHGTSSQGQWHKENNKTGNFCLWRGDTPYLLCFLMKHFLENNEKPMLPC